MTDDATLDHWTRLLAAELDIDAGLIEIDAVLSLAGTVAHSVVRPAAPLSTFLAGYAAGLAAARGTDQAAAIAASMAVVREVAGHYTRD